MGDKIREEVCENSEKSQPGNTVGGENPRAATGKMPIGCRLMGLLRNRRDRGPIFHARKPPNGRIVAQLRYASRLPGIVAGQDYLRQNFTTGFRLTGEKNVRNVAKSKDER
jgi:hypothetical protein